jgi:hypothetical protein
MNFNVNLDNLKPLLKASVDKLDFGIGFSLYYDTNKIDHFKFQASKGREKGFVFYNSVVKIITNPIQYIKGITYQPPADIDYINITMRSIRKVQCDCTLLDLCHNSPEVMEKEYDGYLFDKISRNDGLYQFVVFLPELKLSSRITMRENYDNFDCKKFKLYLFTDEEKFKRKIRLHML